MAFAVATPLSTRKAALPRHAPATPPSSSPRRSPSPPAPAAAVPARVRVRVVAMAANGGAPRRVLVTGATGRTGRLAMARLAEHPDALTPVGLVRSRERAAEVLGEGVEVVVGDVTDRDAVVATVRDYDAVLVLSSATPKFTTPTGGAPPEVYFDDGYEPEAVDWEGGRAIVDGASEGGLSRVVYVGSMGGTNPHHPLNRMGNILKWKRRAEEYLLSSGVPYTVINPGGLLDEPGGGRELVIGHADDMYTLYGTPSIPRADVAALAVQALLWEGAANKAMDVIAKPAGDGTPTTDWAKLFAQAQAQL